MEKDLILIGKADSGKTKKHVKSQKHLILKKCFGLKAGSCLKSIASFSFRWLPRKTKLIIIDDIQPSCNLDFIASKVGVPFQVNRAYYMPLTITAKFL